MLVGIILGLAWAICPRVGFALAVVGYLNAVHPNWREGIPEVVLVVCATFAIFGGGAFDIYQLFRTKKK